jgi:hypothetical protein
VSGFVVTLIDPAYLGGAPIVTHHEDYTIAKGKYRDRLATMWRRPGGSLELEADGEILASFPGKETP